MRVLLYSSEKYISLYPTVFVCLTSTASLWILLLLLLRNSLEVQGDNKLCRCRHCEYSNIRERFSLYTCVCVCVMVDRMRAGPKTSSYLKKNLFWFVFRDLIFEMWSFRFWNYYFVSFNVACLYTIDPQRPSLYWLITSYFKFLRKKYQWRWSLHLLFV